MQMQARTSELVRQGLEELGLALGRLEAPSQALARLADLLCQWSARMNLTGHGDADWVGADILGVDFCGAYLVRRTIEDQNYLHEFRSQSRISAALYWVWWATSDCGRSFFRWGLWTVLLVAVFAGLYETVAVDYGDHPTFLSTKKHTHGDVPVCMAGAGIAADAFAEYHDRNAAESPLAFPKGWDAMAWFLKS